MLEVKDLTKRFGGLVAVNSCSFTVEQGSVTGLIGTNGAGKTTVFNLVAGRFNADSGSIEFKGNRIDTLSPQDRVALGIGRTFQDVRLFRDMTALENVSVSLPGTVAMGVGRVMVRPVHSYMRRRAALTRASEILESIDFNMDESSKLAGELSFGSQKLLSIARLIAVGAELLLLDEPAAGLGGAALEKFTKVITGLSSKGKTVLLVEHNILLVRELCGAAIFMNGGRIEATGAPSDLMEDPYLQRIYLGDSWKV